jgi:hypothetical protein
LIVTVNNASGLAGEIFLGLYSHSSRSKAKSSRFGMVLAFSSLTRGITHELTSTRASSSPDRKN